MILCLNIPISFILKQNEYAMARLKKYVNEIIPMTGSNLNQNDICDTGIAERKRISLIFPWGEI